jgi:hypothetical protein
MLNGTIIGYLYNIVYQKHISRQQVDFFALQKADKMNLSIPVVELEDNDTAASSSTPSTSPFWSDQR